MLIVLTGGDLNFSLADLIFMNFQLTYVLIKYFIKRYSSVPIVINTLRILKSILGINALTLLTIPIAANNI
jgi:hypothetical protein